MSYDSISVTKSKALKLLNKTEYILIKQYKEKEGNIIVALFI
jgi:hypothetical protein